ncbi:phosphatidylinositide phosphatase SAC2 isoform 2 [Mus musculus]|uniref:Isoform 2 of Phosphatidylinositide 4-phosphatase SAC2 n=1 Tax=Mus musculus TaxID=10090 RepID=Q8CDA1-2|nr:phosphatidylinositide phosphatase SAC2 isoform 2 [Mus musculus]EDL17653.1 inositol polyphosphate-5-phosphatase F, isoform CRA_b [Mus musculus]|eukprot:XP_006507217.1 PREDICTED: phosphatidylinositide phosphatase SAC2 isoform X1 [Mus musculus]
MHLTDAAHRDVEVLLLLSNAAYYVAYYDDEVDKVNQYQRLGLEDLERIEIGPEPTLFGKPKFSCMRLHYRCKEAGGYFHTLRAVPRSPEEDGKDTLQCIAEMLQITKQAMGLDVPIIEKKLERKSSKPHEDIIGIRSQNQGSLAQGKSFLMSKFSSLNQKVKQTKSNVNIGNLRKLGNFTKPEMKVNFLKPNLKVNLWKSDSSLETMENPGVMGNKVQGESDGDISSDNDSYHSDEFLTNSKSEEDKQLANSLESVGPIDYILPSCGIIVSAPRLGSRSQSASSIDVSTHAPSEAAAGPGSELGKGLESPLKKSPSADSIHTRTGFTKPMDVYCQRFVQDAQNKMNDLSEIRSVAQKSEEGSHKTNRVSNEETQSEPMGQTPPRPSQLNVSCSVAGPPFLSVEPVHSVLSQKTPSSGSSLLELEAGLCVTPSSESSSSRAVSPFAKIRSSMVQVANITQAGLTHGINLAVAKVQKSPAEPEAVNEIQQNELKNMFTQCQTRIIQI